MCKCCDKDDDKSSDKEVEQKNTPPPPPAPKVKTLDPEAKAKTEKEKPIEKNDEDNEKQKEPLWKEPQSPPEMLCITNAYGSKYQPKHPELSDADESSNRDAVLKNLPDTLESSVDESIDLRPIPSN